jgi:hypothetical protein
VNEDVPVNITSTLLRPQSSEPIQIYKNGSLIANSSSPAFNGSDHQPGFYNITAVYLGNWNYTGTSKTFFMTVLDITPPEVYLDFPPVNYGINETLNLSVRVNATDNVAVDTVLANISWLYGAEYELVELLPVYNDTYEYIFNNTIWEGPYHIAFFVNDTSGNVNDTIWTNFTVIDTDSINLHILNVTSTAGNASFEGQNVTFFVTINNSGVIPAENWTLQMNVSLWDGSKQWIDSVDIFVRAHNDSDIIVYNFSWVLDIGTFVFDFYADAYDEVFEVNETNNNYTLNITVPIWHILYGSYNYTYNLLTDDDENYKVWNVTDPVGVSYFADADAVFNPLQLAPLNGFNDLEEADISLGVDGYLDSIQSLFDKNGDGVPDRLITVTVAGRTINNVPVINSTNSSTFLTGILWDSGDGGAQYTGAQDIIFITIANASQQGAYGVYDFEVRLPVPLRTHASATPLVTRYDELR